MSHHIVTVCMFCLLCAAHTCGSHADKYDIASHEPTLVDTQHISLIEDKRKHESVIEDKRKHESRQRYFQKLQKIRSRDVNKRDIRKEYFDPNVFVDKIFSLYGDPVRKTINMTEFHKMLYVLDLNDDEVTQDNMGGVYSNSQDEVQCANIQDLVTSVNKQLVKHYDAHEHTHDEHLDHSHAEQPIINEESLKAICPILLYQKLANTSHERKGCVQELPPSEMAKLTASDKEALSPEVLQTENSKSMFNVWLYSSLSITAISACGLLGVAVIPIMHKTYYNHLLQFLVALAVGTLCGDALLHLMPHAMSPGGHEHGHGHISPEEARASHNDGMWKGLAAMLGVVFFYFTEKGLTVVVEWRKRRQKLKDDKLPSRVRVLKDDNGGCSRPQQTNSLMKIFKKKQNNEPTTTTCKHKYSEYPYCYDEIETDTHDDHHMRDGQIPPSPKIKLSNKCVAVVSSNALNNDGSGNDEPTAKDKLLNGESTLAVVEMNNINRKEEDDKKDLKDGGSYTVILREHSRAHHGHSHSHGHVHAPPSSIASVAWMVIMGDGLHNFTDGMAIGAAFASSTAGGFSTAIAVLCHELPHELGDFAVLLKAGMSVKRAVCYNILSSALCLAGMVCGVVAGHAPDATRWLFAVAAGMFLYIALVDMMPELSTSHSKEGTLCQCILQLLGLATGIGIMLIIALYEEDLRSLFG